MKKLKLYVETSVWNFIFAEDAPEMKEITKTFFALIKEGTYEVYASDVVLDEIDRAPHPKKEKLMELINQVGPIVFELTPESEELAQQYIKRKIIPANKVEDALHIAIATVAEIDAVITWNYKHLANLRKEEFFQSVNLEFGYLKKIEIITPMEVIGDEM